MVCNFCLLNINNIPYISKSERRFLCADTSHANARCCPARKTNLSILSWRLSLFCPVGNPTGRMRLNENTKKTKPHAAVKRDIRESNPETAHAVSSLSLPGVTPECKQISKGFLPAGNPGSSVYDLYMIHIAPFENSSKAFGKFFKNFRSILNVITKKTDERRKT